MALKKMFGILSLNLLFKPAIWGAGIALTLLLVFVTIVSIEELGRFDPGLWGFLPFLFVGMAGGCGGIAYFLTVFVPSEDGWRSVARVVAVLVFVAAVYFSLILALAINGYWS